MADRVHTFATRLNDLEATGDVEAFVGETFADEAELVRPEAHQQLSGTQGARTFWQQYLAHFSSVRSEFSRLVETGQLGVLEWTSTGSLCDGSDITYAGVTVLDFDDAGRVRRCATYYDTAPFHTSAAKG